MSTREEIIVDAESTRLAGTLAVPSEANGIVVFAHGSGSSRHSTRNRQVADALNKAGFATLLLDLLSDAEHEEDAITREHRFNIPLLAHRVAHAIDHVRHDDVLASLPIGLFGASTGAAAALIAAAQRDPVFAVVSRGGRPDLAGDALHAVRAPTLLIVGERDREVIDLNRHAAARLVAEHRVVTVPGASHLFEEPGALETVQQLAIAWFREWMPQEGRGMHAARPHASTAERRP